MQHIMLISNFPFKVTPLLAVLFIWTIIWKGLALWKAARRNDELWFVLILVINTMGLLEIIYIYLISHRDGKKLKNSSKSQ